MDERPWTVVVAEFISGEAGVEAVRIARGGRVEMATLGRVDCAAVEARLAVVLREVAERVEREVVPAVAPAGFRVRREASGAAVLEKETCVTAPRLWTWTEVTGRARGESEPEEGPEWRTLGALAAVCGVLGVAAFVVDRAGVGPGWLAPVLYAAAMVAGGWDAAKDALPGLPRGKVDIHFLMLAVAGGAASIGAWGEGALLLFLFSLSGALEDYAFHRTRRAIDALLRTAPRTARRVVDGGAEEEVAVESIEPGWRLRVRPGEVFPVDAEVVGGRTAVDESTLTGESVPVERERGDTVSGGTLNLWGAVEVQAVRPAAESALQKIISLIRTAERQKAPSQRFTDRFGTAYTWSVLGVSAAFFAVAWLVAGVPAFEDAEGGRSAFVRAMTLLVVMSPCALVLSIPSAILAAIASGARQGVLFRGGAAIERLGEVDAVALDKTGTLTTGDLRVVAVESLPEGREAEVLALAVALERHSTHPIARAVVAHARRAGVEAGEVEDFRSLTGQGVVGRTSGVPVLLGRRELVARGDLAPALAVVPPAPPEHAEVWLVHGGLIGRILLQDEIRTASAGVLAELKRRGLATVMLTGDRRAAAEAVARELGVAECRAGLSPEDKVAAVRELRAAGRTVAMVGDGVNDAPSLAAADVAVAMGARGSDAALEQADVVLMHDRIDAFLAAHELSRRARAVIRQNIALSLGTVVAMAVAAMGGWVPLAVGVAAHEGSTVLVCLNSLRLLAVRASRVKRR